MSRPKKTHEQFVKEVRIKNKNIEVIGKYENAHKKIELKCIICGFKWMASPQHITGKKPSGCPNCYNKKRGLTQKLTHEEFLNKLYLIHGNRYEVVGKYESYFTKIELKCKRHGNFFIKPANLISLRQGCPKCGILKTSSKEMKSDNVFKNEIKEIVGDEYIVKSKYNGAHRKIEMKHNLCGKSYFTTPRSFLNGRRCPYCKESKGEQSIRRWLELNKINFKSQYEFDNLTGIGGKHLRFDFGLFKKYNSILLIEYDGEFHFKKQYKNDNFEILVNHDKRKNQYCIKDNHISLIRIPYWEFNNIECILENVLKYFNIIESDNTYNKEIVLKYLVNENWDQDKYISIAS